MPRPEHDTRPCPHARRSAWTLARGVAAAALAALLTAGAPARADSIRLDLFQAAERADDGFAVRRLGEVGHLRFGLNVVGDYANDPLIADSITASGVVSRSSVVHEHYAGRVALSFALWERLVLVASLDGTARMRGTSPGALPLAKADGAGLGNTGLGLRVKLVGHDKSVFSLGADGGVVLPSAGSGQTYRGERGVGGRAGLILDVRAPYFHGALNGGALLRKDARVASEVVGSEAVFGLSLGVPVHPRFELLVEGYGGTGLDGFFKERTTHLEWLAGAKANVGGFYFGAGAGTGFANAIGTPDARVVAQLGLLTRGYVEPPPAPPPAPPPPPPDSDADGILDADDRCPREPEDKDGFEDEDGCRELDNDHDGVPDDRDPCMNDAEDLDGFSDDDGCPDPDNDKDGIADTEDACPSEPGVIEERGCKARVQITESGEITIDEQIQFESGKDVILGQSYGILEAVRATLDKHPEVARIRIEGHTDSKGNDKKNLKLSQARARSVSLWLVQHGIAELRLEAYGCGELHPLADNGDDEGRRLNRRVAFQVVDPPPRDALLARPPTGCKASRISVVKLRQ